MDEKLGVIADDLTGALDTAGAFASCGRTVEVHVESTRHVAIDGTSDVICLNTQTREATEFAAAAAVDYGWKGLSDTGCDRLYVKIDSTLRGNVAITCGAALNAATAPALAVCPAFPTMGRSVVNGHVFIDGRPASDTASIPSILEAHSGLRPVTIPVDALRRCAARCVQHRLDAGFNVLVFDAETDSDLDLLAGTLAQIRELVPVGSAGLAYALGRLSGTPIQECPVPMLVRPVLVVSGSFNPTARVQVEALRAADTAQVISLDPYAAAADWRTARSYAAAIQSDITELLKSGANVVLRWPIPQDQSTIDPGSGAKLARFVGALTYGVVSRVRTVSLMIIGGETAYGVLSSLGAVRILVAGELESGVPSGTISGGAANGMPLVTKAGGFGDSDTLTRLIPSTRSTA